MIKTGHNHTPRTIEKICIYSPVRSIGNIMLAEQLERHLKIPCELAVTHSQHTENNLILLDCSETAIARLHQWFGHLQDHTPYMACALINVTPHSPHEKLIDWPQVVGIFYDYESDNDIKTGLTKILAGELNLPIHLCHEFLARRRRAPSLQCIKPLEPKLTRREWQIMEGIYAGYNNYKIADRLCLSQHTVKSHLYSAYKKLGVTSRLEACAWMRDNYPVPVEGMS